MINRRALMVGAIGLSAAKPTWAVSPASLKRRAIETIPLPPGFNGVLAHGRRGRIEHIRCVGLADVEAGKAVRPATRFKWGSASKWLTTVAVLRLVEQKQLDLDAPVTAYLPDFRRDTGGRVLLRHLLSNTSGIPDLLSRQASAEPELRTSTATTASIVTRFGGGDLMFVPGEGWDYAALNWAIIAALLERVSGEALPQLVGRLVFRPLAMAEAGFAQADQPPMPELAAAYSRVAPPERKMLSVPPFLAASGNVASSVNDAMRAAHGIFHGTILSLPSRRELTTVRWPAQEYALGGRVHRMDGDLWAWETGKVQGYRAHIAHRLSRSETIVVFNSTDIEQSAIGGWVEAIAGA